MRTLPVRLLLVVLAFAPSFAPAQDETGRRIQQGDTVLEMLVALATFSPSPPFASRVRVPPLESVRIKLPDSVPEPIQWLKDQQPIPGATGRVLVIPITALSDSGHYNVTSGFQHPYYTAGINLQVVPEGNVSNVSARFELTAGGPPQVLGFAVNGDSSKLLLVRVVGPSLAAFGIKNPAPQPRLQIFDAQGKEVGFVHPAVVFDFEAFFAAVGAFPLTGGERFGLAFDFGSFAPGTYSLVITDVSGAAGTVLAEVYEAAGPPPPATISSGG